MTASQRRLAFTVIVAALAVIGGCGTADAGGSTGADQAQYGIACVKTVDADDGYCDRFMEDLSRRTPLTADQTRTATTAKAAVAQTLSGDVLNRCNVGPEPCDRVMAWAAQPVTQQHITSRLATIGTDPEVRHARPDDPATTDSVLFGVHIGHICIYGYQRLNKDPDQVYAAGPLPQGTCLSP
jgi:hypothetical protein